MFGIGLPEFILILALALIVVGPDKLPDLARSVAKGILDLKKTANTLKESLTEEGNPLDDIKPELEKAAKALTDDTSDDSSGGWAGKNRSYDPRSTGEEEPSEIIDIEVEKDADRGAVKEEAAPKGPEKEVDDSKTTEIQEKRAAAEQQN